MNNELSVLENELIRLKELMEKCLVESIKTNKKLEIAVEALESIRKNNRFCDTNHSNTADDALIEIEEMCEIARETLEKINKPPTAEQYFNQFKHEGGEDCIMPKSRKDIEGVGE